MFLIEEYIVIKTNKYSIDKLRIKTGLLHYVRNDIPFSRLVIYIENSIYINVYYLFFSMKFFLIDGSSFLYRAYYAFPPMNDKDGHNINVVYGFFRMLMKIFQEKPDYFVITWDSPVKTLRHEEYAEYKANRKKMDDDFKHQIPITKAIVDQLGIPSLIVPTYEADDIIYTLAMKYKSDKNTMIDIYS